MHIYLAEETQKVLDALDNENPSALKDELGDLLFQILLYGQIASERGWFTSQEIVDELHHKIIRRNQHVFGELVLMDLEAVNLHWQCVKINERDRNNERKNRVMYAIAIEQNEALVTVKNYIERGDKLRFYGMRFIQIFNAKAQSRKEKALNLRVLATLR